MGWNKFFKPKLNAVKQLFHITNKFSVTNATCRGDKISWELEVRATPLSKLYVISYSYVQGKSPIVLIKNQGILKSAKDKIPHCYERVFRAKDNQYIQLCLYLPGEWNSSMVIADTIIPWSIEWLYFYEQWRITKKWLGGGHDA